MRRSVLTSARAARVRWVVAAVVVTTAGVVIALWQPAGPVPPADGSAPLPPLSDSPFKNARVGVAYVGDEACAGCHPATARTYHQHPMGRSLFAADAAPPAERYDAPSNPFRAGPFRFEAARRGDRVVHREWCTDAAGRVVAEQEEEVAYAIGSGTQSRSYLVRHGDFLFESPITWYVRAGEWQLSPGYAENQSHFGRGIISRCLYCHSQEPRPVAGTTNRYQDPPFGQLAIGCERCHGPGELHVAARRTAAPTGDVDDTIVNPRHLAPALREAVCQQCHLQGEAIIARRGRDQADYRPGLPLDEYVTVFVRPPDARDSRRIVGHVEQMGQSACFQKSGGAFGCTSCHDPHRAPAPAEKAAFYRDKCKACHGAAEKPVVAAPDCALPPAQRADGDNCVACHMPRSASTVTAHLAVTDHRVLRRPDRPPPAAATPADDIPLVAFHRPRRDPADEEAARDLGVAAMDVADQTGDGDRRLADALATRALPLLDRATTRAPDDVPAQEARGAALIQVGRAEEALAVLEATLARAPGREHALSLAADAAAAVGRLDAAEDYARRLAEACPFDSLAHERLAAVRILRDDRPGALEAAREAARLGPFRPGPRAQLVILYAQAGDRARARTEFETLGVIDPAAQARLRPRVGILLGGPP